MDTGAHQNTGETDEEELRLRAMVDTAEQSRLSGDAGVDIEEARSRINELVGKPQECIEQ